MTGSDESVAAEQPADAGSPRNDRPGSGRRLLRRPNGWGWVAPVAVATAGVLMATSAMAAQDSDRRADRRTSLADLVQSRQDEVRVATDRVAELQAEVDRLAAEADSDDGLDEVRSTIDRLAAPAGLTPVAGPSLQVSLDDAPRPERPRPDDGITPDDLVVHQEDVQAVVNALWAGGAEAMQIMDQRVISTSAVRCVGNTLVLQGRVYSPPFVITAVGDVNRMQEALDRSPGVRSYRQWVDAVGLGYDVVVSEHTVLPAYAGGLRLEVTEGERA